MSNTGRQDLTLAAAPFPPGRFASARALLLAAALLGCGEASRGSAQEVVAVLSSDSKAYSESYEGFKKEWGRPVPVLNLSREGAELPGGALIVVAFGSKAALRAYPDSVTLIYWAPGLGLQEELKRKGPALKINMGARPALLAAQLKELQPGLKDLRIFYIAPYYAAYVRDLRLAAPWLAVNADRLNSADELPDRIRAMPAKPDAVLILNDPLLINADTFLILRNYSWDNDVPLYAPTAGLAEQGAAASLGPTFEELGRTAALEAREVLAGRRAGGEVYAGAVDLSVNLGAAAKTGLAPGRALLKKAKHIFP